MPDLILLTAAGSLLRVESSPEVMDEIRSRALAGYRALRKTGVGVGGLLLGERDGAGVRVLESVELECSHAFGPGFVLTPQEKAQGRELVNNAGAMAVVGWYFSRTRGEAEMTDQERALYGDLFPAQTHKQNQVTLILMPAPDAPAGSELFIAGAQGLMVKAVERDPGVVTAAPAAVEPLPPEPPVCVPLIPLPEPLLPEQPPLPAFLRSAELEDGERLESGKLTRWTRIVIAIVLMVVGLAVFEAQSLWVNEAVPVNRSAGSGLQTVPAGR